MKKRWGRIIPALCLLLALGGGQAAWAATRAVQLRVDGCHT